MREGKGIKISQTIFHKKKSLAENYVDFQGRNEPDQKKNFLG